MGEFKLNGYTGSPIAIFSVLVREPFDKALLPYFVKCEDASEPPQTVGGGPVETLKRRTVASMVNNVFIFDPDKSSVSISNWIPMIFTFKSTIDKASVEKIFDTFVGKILQKCPKCGINADTPVAKGDAASVNAKAAAAAAAAAAAKKTAAAPKTPDRTIKAKDGSPRASPPPPLVVPSQKPKGGRLSDEHCDCVRTDRVLSYSVPIKGDVYGIETDKGIVYNTYERLVDKNELKNATLEAKNVYYSKTREYAPNNGKNYNIYWSNNEKDLEKYINIELRARLQKQMTKV